MRLPEFEEIAAFTLGGFFAYVFVLGAPYTLVEAVEARIALLAEKVETLAPGLTVDPGTATWTYTPEKPGVMVRFRPGGAS